MARRPVVLVVDDDPSIRAALCDELAAAGCDTVEAADGEEGIARFAEIPPDLVLTDLAMPRADGFALLRSIRRQHRTPVVVLSVRGGESDKIRALDLGADDYVTKPFSLPELLARVRTQLRRAAPPSTSFRFAELAVDLETRRVEQGGRDVHLTPTEFAILEVLVTHAGAPGVPAADHRQGLGCRRGDLRHGARPRRFAAPQARAGPFDAALPGDRALGRLPVHRRAARLTPPLPAFFRVRSGLFRRGSPRLSGRGRARGRRLPRDSVK